MPLPLQDSGRSGVRGPGPHLLGASSLLTDPVWNTANQPLGTLKELMLEVSTGRIAYAVLDVRDRLGLRHRLYAVPWSALTLDTVNRRFILDVSRDRLRQTPGFDPQRWPSMADETWALQNHRLFENPYRSH